MNEVSGIPQTTAQVVARASSLGAAGQRAPGSATGSASAGKLLPPAPVQPSAQTSSEPVVAKEPLENVVAQLNDYLQAEQRNLEFNVDEELGFTVIRVVDRNTGDLIRQIPEDIFLDLARQAKEQEPIQLINVQG